MTSPRSHDAFVVDGAVNGSIGARRCTAAGVLTFKRMLDTQGEWWRATPADCPGGVLNIAIARHPTPGH